MATKLEANKEYYYCTCGKSEDGIFCNGAHKGTEFTPKVFTVGYARAGRIIDQMEERGVISGYQGSKPREVLMTLEKLNELKMSTQTEK